MKIQCRTRQLIVCCTYLDYKTGFGGKFGVQDDRQDKSALGWDHIEKSQKHDSQKGEFLLKILFF